MSTVESSCPDGVCGGVHPEGHVFYVSVRDGQRTGFLLGPYGDHGTALANVERGRKLACDANDRAWFYSYGTASLPADTVVSVVFTESEGAK